MIEDGNSLRPIAMARSLVSKAPVVSLPSWVPDWTGTEKLVPLQVRKDANFDTETRLDIPINARFSADGKVISLTGVLCDVVSALQPWARQYRHERDLCQTLRNKSLPNGVSYLRAVFHILAFRHDSYLEMLPTSEEYMVQALHFLLLLARGRASAEERRSELTELAHIMFGGTDNAFSKILDWFFFNEGTAYGLSMDDYDAQQYRRLKSIGERFCISSATLVRNRVFFETENGTVGIGPEETLVGDVIFRPPGYCGFFVLRQIENHYVLVGEGDTFRLQTDSKAEDDDGLRTVDIW